VNVTHLRHVLENILKQREDVELTVKLELELETY
jgi:hypothetical protein